MVVFRDDKTIEDEMKAWEFWHSRQHSVKQRILDIGMQVPVILFTVIWQSLKKRSSFVLDKTHQMHILTFIVVDVVYACSLCCDCSVNAYIY